MYIVHRAPAPSLPTPLPPLCLSAPAPGVPEMGDFAAPSFSLGLDLDDLSTEEEPEGDEKSPMEGPEGGRSPLPGASISGSRHFQQVRGGDEERDFPMEDPGEDASLSTPTLRRLKRGPPPTRRREMLPGPPDDSSTPGDARQFSTLDDDIEEFLSQEDPVVRGGWLLRPVSLLHWSGSGKPWIRLDANRPCPLDALWAPYDLNGPSP